MAMKVTCGPCPWYTLVMISGPAMLSTQSHRAMSKPRVRALEPAAVTRPIHTPCHNETRAHHAHDWDTLSTSSKQLGIKGKHHHCRARVADSH